MFKKQIFLILVISLAAGCYIHPDNSARAYGIIFDRSPNTEEVSDQMIAEWTEKLIELWHSEKGYPKPGMFDSVDGIVLEAVDVLYFEMNGRKYKGYIYPDSKYGKISTISETMNPIDLSKSLFKHEVSHIIYGCAMGDTWNEDEHHSVFAEMGGI